MNRPLLIILFCFHSATLFAQCSSNRYTGPVFSGVTVNSGILFGSATPYASLLPQNLYLDLYTPAGDTLTSRPLIVYAFGGGFLIGTRVDPPIPTYCSYLAQCGYVVASIDYRIGFDVADSQSAERAVYRGVQDLRGAVRFLCQNFQQYGIDTTAIFLTGSSAGCFSGLHSTFVEQSDWPPCIHGTFLEPADLGCMDCDDNADNSRRMPFIKGIVNHWGAIFDTSFIRTTLKDHVPTISLQGNQDPIVPYNVGPPFSLPIFPNVYGSLPIHERMNHISLQNELITFWGYGHEPWLLAPQLIDTCYLYEIPFLYSVLQPGALEIKGDTTLCLNSIGRYTVPSVQGSHFCWSSSSGNIFMDSNNVVYVHWTRAGNQTITVQELTRNLVSGNLYSMPVNVIDPPVAGFTDSVVHSEVFFRDSSLGAISWAYNFGDSTGSAQPNPVHLYLHQDSFQVRLIASNGYCADTTYKWVETDTCPSEISIQFSQVGDTVIFNASPPGTNYQWSFGDGDTSAQATPSHVYRQAQDYLVSIWLNTTNGCRAFGSLIFQFKPTSGVTVTNAFPVDLFPQPASEVLYLHTNGPAKIQISAVDGAILYTSICNSLPEADHLINLSGFVSGLYLLQLTTADGVYTKKCLILR